MDRNELRVDPFTGEKAIISAQRSKRPSDFKGEKKERGKTKRDESCFFCPGNEKTTPPTIAKKGEPWRIRVFENKFPAATTAHDFSLKSGLLKSSPSYGHHEIIVETDEHWKQPQDFSREEMRELLEMYQSREKAQYEDENVKSVLLFRNHLEGGGASLEHAHSQLVSLPFVHPRLAKKRERFEAFEKNKGGCLFCRVAELEKKERLVKATENFLVLAPFASRWAFQTLILPKKHSPFFGEAELGELDALLLSLLKAYDELFSDPPYNFFFQSAQDGFHWHFELFPVLQTPAGLEKGGDIFINTMPPEDAAESLGKAMED